MRPTCLNCARKHLAKALINMNESRLGYPTFQWLAIGHMSEAEDELLARYPDQAYTIREHRKQYEDDADYIVPILELINALTALHDRQMQEADGSDVLPRLLEESPVEPAKRDS
jgi:hypothetical protein